MNTDNCYSQADLALAVPIIAETTVEWVIQHKRYDCPLYLWSASGFVKLNKHCVEERYFLYIEYRAHNRASRYIIEEFKEWRDLVYFADCQADSLTIRDISPEMTRRFTIVTT